MTPASLPYRPAVRGLVFGLVALGLRAATMGLFVVIALREARSGSRLSSSVDFALLVVPAMNLVATLLALVGFGYSAIAAHRKEWGVTLVFAFVTSVVAAVLDIETFVYGTV